ncbi:unnamed protein product [Effrenium voratum]|uniref:Sulfhydryl oxidase n=1 Tax=Effrenium voratum TaxID=2562239 RepID=A0AA36IUU5_9DINO|nr:unnamed protein product [Effrenium voratum]
MKFRDVFLLYGSWSAAGLNLGVSPPANDTNVTANASGHTGAAGGNVTNVSRKELPSPDAFRNSEVWGPPTWFFLHSVTLALPEKVPQEQQAQIKNLVLSLQEVLPCPLCAEHWRKNMDEDPIEPHLGSREALVDWLIGMHNKVNKRKDKPVMTRDQVLGEFQLAYDKFGRFGGYQAVLGDTKSAASGLGFGLEVSREVSMWKAPDLIHLIGLLASLSVI